MTAQEIIAAFELKVDDSTELSTSEELALLNRVYQLVCDERPWEILKKKRLVPCQQRQPSMHLLILLTWWRT